VKIRLADVVSSRCVSLFVWPGPPPTLILGMVAEHGRRRDEKTASVTLYLAGQSFSENRIE
jgi:hypothetical protein